LSGGHAHGDGRLAHCPVHALDARHGVSQDRQEGVKHQRYYRGALADAAYYWYWDQEPEQGQAGDGLQDAGKPEGPSLGSSPVGQGDSGREGYRDRDRHGDADQSQVLPGEVENLSPDRQDTPPLPFP